MDMKTGKSESPLPSSKNTPAAQELPEGSELFRSLFEQAATGVAVTSITGRFLRVNRALCRMTGYSEPELLEKAIADITHPEDIESNEKFRSQLLSRESETRTLDKRYLRKDGASIWVQIVLTVVRDDAGSPRCCVSVIHDISGLRRAQEALQESEARFRRMVNLSSDWYWMQDEQFRFVEIPGIENRHFNRDVALGKARWEFPDLGPLPEKVWQQHKEVLERHLPFSDFVFLRYNKGGQLRYLSVSGEPIFDTQGKFSGYQGVGKDATEQVRAQKALEASEKRYRLLFDVHPQPMWVVDSKTLEFLAVNEAALKHYGYTREEFLRLTADQIRPPEDVSELLREFEHRGRSYRHGVWQHRKKSGELIDVDIISFNLDFDGRPARLAVVTDITERLKAERKAQEAAGGAGSKPA
jgi:PAS domain S-box-containing protein